MKAMGESLFDGPVGPPEEEPPAPEPPKPKRPRTRKMRVNRGTDADLDAQLVDNTADAIDPGYDGHMMRVAGVPWAQIARRIGSPTPAAAMATVSKYLSEAAKAQSAQHMQEALQTQVDRYEQILQAWWPQATDLLDEKAATVVLRALERLDRVLRLTDSEMPVSRETIVVSGNPEEYVKQLKAVVQDRRPDTPGLN